MKRSPDTSFQKIAERSAAVYPEPGFQVREAGDRLALAFARSEGMTESGS